MSLTSYAQNFENVLLWRACHEVERDGRDGRQLGRKSCEALRLVVESDEANKSTLLDKNWFSELACRGHREALLDALSPARTLSCQ